MTPGGGLPRGLFGHIIHHKQSLAGVRGVRPNEEILAQVDMAGPTEITSANRGAALGDEPAPPSRLMATLDPSTVDLFPSAMLISAPVKGWSPTEAGPSLRGERGAAIGGSLANGLETTPSLKDDSHHAGEHAVPGDSLRMSSPTRGLVHQGVIKISQEKTSITPIERGIVGA